MRGGRARAQVGGWVPFVSQLPEGWETLTVCWVQQQATVLISLVTDRDDMDRDFFLFTREAEARPMADLDTILLRALMR